MPNETRAAAGQRAGTAGHQQPPYWLGGWADGKRLPTNPDSAQRFLRWLDPSTDTFAFRCFHETDRTRPAVKLWGTLDQHWQQLDRLNRDGYGVFVTVNETDGEGVKRKNVTRVRCGVVDWDGQPLPDPERHDAHAIVWTSAPRDGKEARAHGYWRASIALDDFRLVQQGLADEFQGDASVHDLPRVMRLPGFVHGKRPDALFLVRAWWLNHDAAPLTVADFRRMFPSVDARFVTNARQQQERERQRHQQPPIRTHGPSAFLNAWHAWLQREASGIRDQGRHDLLKRAARHLLDNGLTEREAQHELVQALPVFPARADGSVPADEARDMVSWVYANVPPGDPWTLTGTAPASSATHRSSDRHPLDAATHHPLTSGTHNTRQLLRRERGPA